MGDDVYTARSTVVQLGGLHRRATLESGAEVDFGVHGRIKELFRLAPERDLPLPVDYIVAATGG